MIKSVIFIIVKSHHDHSHQAPCAFIAVFFESISDTARSSPLLLRLVSALRCRSYAERAGVKVKNRDKCGIGACRRYDRCLSLGLPLALLPLWKVGSLNPHMPNPTLQLTSMTSTPSAPPPPRTRRLTLSNHHRTAHHPHAHLDSNHLPPPNEQSNSCTSGSTARLIHSVL
jgi:hypothetical protein